MSKEKCRKNMSRVARSINVFRKSLKEQEAKNKALRDQITPMWGDKSKDGRAYREISGVQLLRLGDMFKS